MLPIHDADVKHDLDASNFHCVNCISRWTLFLGQPKILRMEAKDVSQDSPMLLDRMRAEIRVRHYSTRTEEVYVDWARRFILFHNKRHPKEMGAEEVRDFLNYLAVERNVSASTQNQAKSALLFL